MSVTMTNSENERVTISEVTQGKFKGQKVLVVHDEPPIDMCTAILLDKSTVEFLLKYLPREE